MNPINLKSRKNDCVNGEKIAKVMKHDVKQPL